MAITFLPLSAPTLIELIATLNTELALIPGEALQGFSVTSLDQTRLLGRDYRAILSHDAGTAVLASPYVAVGFEGSSPDDVTAALTAFAAAHPADFVSPAFHVGLPAGRFEPQSAAIVFWSTDTANARTNWAISGMGGGGGGGDHSLLVNRDLVSQHPARAVTYDSQTALVDASTVIVDSIPITAGVGAACLWEFFVTSTAAPNTEFFLGRFSAATGPAGGAPGWSAIIDVAGSAGFAGLTLSADVSLGFLRFRAALAGVAAGASLFWRRSNLTPPT